MIKNKLSEIMGKNRIRIAELARISGISQNTLIKIYYEKTKGIDFTTLDKLCCALKCNISELFEYVVDEK